MSTTVGPGSATGVTPEDDGLSSARTMQFATASDDTSRLSSKTGGATTTSLRKDSPMTTTSVTSTHTSDHDRRAEPSSR